MEILTTLGTAFGIITPIGVVIGGIALAINYFSRGKRQERGEIISSADQLTNYWEKQVEGWKKVADDLTKKLDIQTETFNAQMRDQAQKFNDQLQTIGTELGQVRGKYEAEKAQNERLEKIFQNRDPETQVFQKFMMDSSNKRAEIDVQILAVLSELQKTTLEIYSMAKDEHDRDFSITSTIHKS